MDDFDIAEFLEECEMHTATVQNAIKCLERLSKFNGKGHDVIVCDIVVKTMTSVMRRYEIEQEVQSMGIVCLENFFRHNEINYLGLDTIDELVKQLIIIIESHSDNDQMMKSALWILSNPIILRDGKFDSRCFKAVMNYFVTSHDPEVDDWAVKICFEGTLEAVSRETNKLNFPPQYRTKLLSMIRPHAKSKPIDLATLIVAIKSLVNVTSENLPVCEILIKDGDVEIFIEMLDTFQGEIAVEAPLLGIMYNVVEEVKLFRQQLAQRTLFISKICQLLDSDHISVSCEAAGIMAYLLLEMPTRTELLDKLHRVIMNWKVPETEVLASYRSFKPLYSLLQGNVHPVQLYAAWCIYQSCVTDSVNYCDMLFCENGMELLQKLEADETTHSDVRNMCRNIHEVYLKDLERLQKFHRVR